MLLFELDPNIPGSGFSFAYHQMNIVVCTTSLWPSEIFLIETLQFICESFFSSPKSMFIECFESPDLSDLLQTKY